MVLRRWTFRWILGPPWRPRGGDTAAAEEEVGELARLGDTLTATKSGYWTTEVEVSRLAAAASQEPTTRLALYARPGVARSRTPGRGAFVPRLRSA
jgi:hypothetical protein